MCVSVLADLMCTSLLDICVFKLFWHIVNIYCLIKQGHRDQYAGPISVLFQICRLNTVNELFQWQVKRECFIEGVSFLSVCMKANVFVSNRKSGYFSVCLLLLCVCVAADARPLGGIWLSGRAIKRPVLCVRVCVCPCVWQATRLGPEQDLNVHPKLDPLYSSPLTKTQTHTHTSTSMFGKQAWLICTEQTLGATILNNTNPAHTLQVYKNV